MRAVDIILKKRNRGELDREEIEFFIRGMVSGEIPDYQASAWLMAVWFNGLNQRETVDLTRAMLYSGETIDLSEVEGFKVDKHSTGGVGDKTSLVVGPLVAAAGLKLAKMSGRGMGHSGGTLDKLLSFEGFKYEISQKKFLRVINQCGMAIIGQSKNLVPADKILYSLRDVTGTVDQMSLIASSIMSKKLAAGADAIVLDVKTGRGAFMANPDDAFELARIMVDIGKSMGRKVQAIITDMEQPLGNTVGNILEVKEAIETLRGKGPKDLLEVCLELAGSLLVMGGKSENIEEARKLLMGLIKSGAALKKLREMVKLQGGSTEIIDVNKAKSAELPFHPIISLDKTGYVTGIDARTVGETSMLLGAGRANKDEQIDLNAG
ncbi:MAG: thymidine phosphorylase, partial [Bacteroidetes bacterium]|nr:thymidine phosphorylase [Bacteroidota bacterium]